MLCSAKGGPLRIQDLGSSPLSRYTRGESWARIQDLEYSRALPLPSGRLRTPDLGSWIVRLAPHTVSAKPDPGFWISTSNSGSRMASRIPDGARATRSRLNRIPDAGSRNPRS
eukprot:scaffold80333_cov57-Phaeocystis_antarctica.AAC.2